MPKSYTEFAQHNPPYRIVCDYIAGMTDHFLLQRYEDLLGTGSARSAN
jgi:dGTP triphosphohydrolase